MKVFIDGENLRHRLAEVLRTEKRIATSDNHFKFNLEQLLQTTLGANELEVLYYTTKIRLPKFKIPQKLSTRITDIQDANRRWLAQLTNQHLHVVKAGHLKVRESSSCIHCNKKTLVLQEKGVDVRLATDMVIAALHDKAPQVAVLSSDADIIPALQVVKAAGTKISYVCFAEDLNRAVATEATETLTFTRKDITAAFDQASARKKKKPASR